MDLIRRMCAKVGLGGGFGVSLSDYGLSKSNVESFGAISLIHC